MLHFLQIKALQTDTFCPACERAVQEGGRTVTYRHARLCAFHRSQFIKLLCDPHASQAAVYYWLKWVR